MEFISKLKNQQKSSAHLVSILKIEFQTYVIFKVGNLTWDANSSIITYLRKQKNTGLFKTGYTILRINEISLKCGY